MTASRGRRSASTSLSIGTGDFVVLTGRSGCGKTSLLNVAAGFVDACFRQRRGSTARPIAAPGADRAVVFQNDALFPWLTARENVAFALRMRGVREGRARRARRRAA